MAVVAATPAKAPEMKVEIGLGRGVGNAERAVAVRRYEVNWIEP